jgi:hypothetical protein
MLSDSLHVACSSWHIIVEDQGGSGWVAFVWIKTTIKVIAIDVESLAGAFEQRVEQREPKARPGIGIVVETQLQDICLEFVTKMIVCQSAITTAAPGRWMRSWDVFVGSQGKTTSIADAEARAASAVHHRQLGIRRWDSDKRVWPQRQFRLISSSGFAGVVGPARIGARRSRLSRLARGILRGHEAKFWNQKGAAVPTGQWLTAGPTMTQGLLSVG